jgi:hypothetical protein
VDDSNHRWDDVDPGEPIPQLRGLELPPGEGFEARLAERLNTNEIHHRTAEFTLAGTTWILLEYLGLAFGFQPDSTEEERDA